MTKLNQDQRLVYAGRTKLRNPDGTALSVPHYMIVPADSADPNRTVELHDTECLVQIGIIHNDKKSAEKRFEDLKAGREPRVINDAMPLYIKESIENINPKTNLSMDEEEIYNQFAKYLASELSRQMEDME